ncbi:MAG TPA: hypothetical protein VG944_02250 [Fimbriimonas sp.]|nr:hypothetical protein [Fimbriimonas sp.]
MLGTPDNTSLTRLYPETNSYRSGNFGDGKPTSYLYFLAGLDVSGGALTDTLELGFGHDGRLVSYAEIVQ